MSVEINPVGLACARDCIYCYLGAARRAACSTPVPVDHAAIRRQVLASGANGFTLFGGEPLLASVEDLERLWAFGLETYGRNGVQTDGHVVTAEHMALFRRYRVHVGFSVDGPGELNDARVCGTRAETREATARSEAALRRCLGEGIPCSLIVTVHRLNASPDRLPRLLAWLRELAAAGLRSMRLHALELDGGARAIALTIDEALAAFRAVRELGDVLRVDTFRDLAAKLLDPDAAVSCAWSDCDPWTTTAVHGIGPGGERTGCGRGWKNGRQWVPLEGPSRRIRQAILWATPQADGGCAGCRFFSACGGQCPGTAVDGDWRRRSADCRLWFALLEDAEAELVARGERPGSLAPDLEARVASRLARYAAPGDHGAGRDAGHGDHSDHGDHADLAPVLGGLVGGERVAP